MKSRDKRSLLFLISDGETSGMISNYWSEINELGVKVFPWALALNLEVSIPRGNGLVIDPQNRADLPKRIDRTRASSYRLRETDGQYFEILTKAQEAGNFVGAWSN